MPMMLTNFIPFIFIHLFSTTFASRLLPPLITMPSNTVSSLYCNSWKNAVESNAAVDWSVPMACNQFARTYMTSDQYMLDSLVIADLGFAFAKTIDVTPKDAWIFDVDDTLLSFVPYLSSHQKGGGMFNKSAALSAWEFPSDLPALPASLALYNELKQLGFKIFLLTGRYEMLRDITEKNLQAAGYTNWERLIMREPCDESKVAVVYKSQKRAELEFEGYIIQGSSGDQWSDLLGFSMAKRSFKLPNLMYFVP